MRKTILLAASALSTVAAANAANAQASAPTQVEAVQVTARTLEDTLPEQLSQAGVKVEVIPGQAIRNGGYADVGTALQTLAPGLFILPQNGPFSYVDVSLLGSRTQDVLWLIDGVRINNRLYATTTPLDTVPAGIVDHIEQIEGGQSLFYGTQAVAGAINIVTKPYSDVLTGSVRVGGDTNRSGHIDGNVADRFKYGQFVLYGSGDVSSGYRPFREQDYQPSATDRSRNYAVGTLGGKYAVDLSQQLRLQASYQRTQAKLDYGFGPYRVNEYINNRAEDLGTLKLDYQATDRLAFFIKGYGHNWHTEYTAKINLLPAPYRVYDLFPGGAVWGYWDYGVNALGKYDVSRGIEAYFGYDYQSYGGKDEVLVIRQQDENTHAGFGQIRLTPDLIPYTTLTAGVRYNAPSVGKSATVWTVTGKYELPSGFYLKGEAGTNFRLPTAEELFADDPFDERGNPNLKPESSIGGNLTVGLRFALAGHASRIEVTGFSRDIDNLITLTDFDAKTNQDVFGNLTGTMRTRGGQFLAETAVTSALSANVNVTYSQSKDSNGDQLERVPESLYKAGLDWHPADLPVGASVGYVYTGRTTKTVLGRTANYGDYATMDISGRYFIDAARHHQLNLSVQNLFDRQYGQPYRGCRDNFPESPLACGKPYAYTALGLPRTVSVSYRYSF